MSSADAPQIIVFQIHKDAFSFLCNENELTESSDFGYIWSHFFDIGGYRPIVPYAMDDKPVNVWYQRQDGQEIYAQGLLVGKVAQVPDGYTLLDFPASDYLVVTTEWMASNEEAVGEHGNGQCNRYAETVQPPPGYIRNDAPGSPLTKIERENADTPEGSRYEVWIPIKKQEPAQR